MLSYLFDLTLCLAPLNPHRSKSLLKGETSDVSPSRVDKEGRGTLRGYLKSFFILDFAPLTPRAVSKCYKLKILDDREIGEWVITEIQPN